MKFEGKIKELEINNVVDASPSERWDYKIVIDQLKQSEGIAASTGEGEVTITGYGLDQSNLPSGRYPDEVMSFEIKPIESAFDSELGNVCGSLIKAVRNTDKTITYTINSNVASFKIELPEQYKYKLLGGYQITWGPVAKN